MAVRGKRKAIVKHRVIPFVIRIICAGACLVSALSAAETKEQHDARMKWWREARFGLFIHWGIYSVPAGTYEGKQIPNIGEWIMNFGKIPVARYAAYALYRRAAEALDAEHAQL